MAPTTSQQAGVKGLPCHARVLEARPLRVRGQWKMQGQRREKPSPQPGEEGLEGAARSEGLPT